MKLKMHPTVLWMLALASIAVAFLLIVLRAAMCAEGLGTGPAALAFGFSLDVIELMMLAFIRSPVAPKVASLLGQWGYEEPEDTHPLEQIIDVATFAALLAIYVYDFQATRLGCLQHGIKPQFAPFVALVGVLVTEMTASIGFWLLEDAKVLRKATDESTGFLRKLKKGESRANR